MENCNEKSFDTVMRRLNEPHLPHTSRDERVRAMFNLHHGKGKRKRKKGKKK